MNLEINRICKCGHLEEVHGADPDADPNREDELVESGQFYSCQAEGCDCEFFEEAVK